MTGLTGAYLQQEFGRQQGLGRVPRPGHGWTPRQPRAAAAAVQPAVAFAGFCAGFTCKIDKKEPCRGPALAAPRQRRSPAPRRSVRSMKTWTQRRSVRSAAACAAGHTVAPRGVAARRFRLVECAAVPTAQRWRAPPPPQHLPISRVCTCGLSMPCNARICALGKFALFNHMNKSVPY